MKKLMIVLLMLLFLTGCGVFERGNYDKDRSGYVLSGDLIVSYHTNSIGEIDVFLIDQVFTYFEALEYVDFDINLLDDDSLVSSIVTSNELDLCGIEHDRSIPRFIRIEDKTYYFNARDNGHCSFDQYEFHELGYSDEVDYVVRNTSPLEDTNKTLFNYADFKVNTFETVVFIETVSFNNAAQVWEKEIVTALPMSIKQAGNVFEDNTDFVEEVAVIEMYVLDNQSVNLLVLKEDYLSEDVNNIWSEYTIDRLGRDHDIIKSVRIKKTGDILEIINDTLSRLGMFS